MNNTKNKDHQALENLSSVFSKLIDKEKIEKEGIALDVKDLTFNIKKRMLLNKVSFQVKRGTFHGFLGPNGAGKTTTIKNLMDAYKTHTAESQMKFYGHDAGTIEAKKKYAYIPEYAAFPPHLSAKEYLITMARFSGMDKKESSEKALELSKLLGLEKHMSFNPNMFSSGMKKKILIAQALMTSPSILILDEPAANLDPLARNSLFASLKDLTQHGIAIFISSHILAELEGLVDSITLINSGNIVYSGPIETFTKQQKKKGMKVYSDKKMNDIVKLAQAHKAIAKKQLDHVNVEFTNDKELFQFLGAIAKDEIEVSKIEFNKVSLQDIYNSKFGGK